MAQLAKKPSELVLSGNHGLFVGWGVQAACAGPASEPVSDGQPLDHGDVELLDLGLAQGSGYFGNGIDSLCSEVSVSTQGYPKSAPPSA